MSDSSRPAVAAVHLYPTTMNTYGDRGNVAALRQRAAWRGIDLRWHPVELGEPAPDTADLIFIGGGQDRVQHAIAQDLAARREWLVAALESGTVLLGVCAGLQLLGRRYVAADGSELAGLGLLDLETVAGDWRLIGNVVVEIGTESGPRLLAGFENHGGRTHLYSTDPLGRVLCGRGNNGVDGTEGARRGTIRATYLHGPVLPKNAWFTDELLAGALRHAGIQEPLAPLDDTFENAAQLEAAETAERDEKLRRRSGLRGAAGRAREALLGAGRAAARQAGRR
jgi:hypothetical protein